MNLVKELTHQKVDFSYLNEITGGNNRLMLSLLNAIIKGLREYPLRMEEAFKEGETRRICEAAHKFKSTIAPLEYDTFSEVLSDLELAIKNKLPDSEIKLLIKQSGFFTKNTLVDVLEKAEELNRPI
ncbi:hypothetical protein AAG747_15080 [Rapidithrix thailandica]|uniref:HPt domain-containing protein n=1 Tax=Rapidithrix thailandica TaxID=413964 RepID=A0AAW9SEW0_9BACT